MTIESEFIHRKVENGRPLIFVDAYPSLFWNRSGDTHVAVFTHPRHPRLTQQVTWRNESRQTHFCYGTNLYTALVAGMPFIDIGMFTSSHRPDIRDRLIFSLTGVIDVPGFPIQLQEASSKESMLQVAYADNVIGLRITSQIDEVFIWTFERNHSLHNEESVSVTSQKPFFVHIPILVSSYPAALQLICQYVPPKKTDSMGMFFAGIMPNADSPYGIELQPRGSIS